MTSPMTRTVAVGDHEYTIERASGRKASRALALLKAISRAMPDLNAKMAAFTREFEETHYEELDRAKAALRWPARTLVDEENRPVLEPATLEDGSPNPRAGERITVPSPLDGMTEADWERVGHVIRLPQSPDTLDVVLGLFGEAMDAAEENVYRLVALFTVSNADVKAWWKDGTFTERLDERADELLDDVLADDLMELAASIGEVVDAQFVTKARALTQGGRLGNLGRLIGLTPTEPAAQTPTTPTTPGPEPMRVVSTEPSSDGPSTSTPTSSTASPAPTDGQPTTSSTSPGTSSSPSSSGSDETPIEPTPSATTPTTTATTEPPIPAPSA